MTTESVPGTERRDVASPLSAAQRSIWFAQQLDPATPLSIAQYIDVRGPLDTELLSDVGRTVTREFDTMMVRLQPGDPEPVQVVDHSLRDEMIHLDYRDHDDPHGDAIAWMEREFGAPVDLITDRLVEVATIRIADERYYWYTRIHHILLDGYGAAVFADRAAQLYTARTSGEFPPPSKAGTLEQLFADDAKYRSSTRFERDREYWSERVRDLPDPIRLTEPTGRVDVRSRLSGRILDRSDAVRLTAACERLGTTVPAIVSAAAALYLARMADSQDVTLSLPVSGRTSALLRRSGGMMSNVVPIRARVHTTTTVADLVTAVGAEILGALRHQRFRVEDMKSLVDDSVSGSSAGDRLAGAGRGFFGPAVNIMTFHTDLLLGPCVGSSRILTTGPVEDLAFDLYTGVGDGDLRIELEANPTACSQDELDTHHSRFVTLLGALADASADTLVADLTLGADTGDVPMLGPSPVDPVTLPELFAHTVSRHGHETALIFGEHRSTYYEVHARASRLARVLIDHGVGPGSVVAVVAARGPASVVSELAVSMAGGAFVPLDPALPTDRLAYLLQDSGARLGVTDANEPPTPDIEWLLLMSPQVRADYRAASPRAVTDHDRLAPLTTQHPAYVIYTSGSTGMPKGVVVTHRGLASLSAEQVRRYGLDSGSRSLHFASPSFDASILELLLAIGSGAAMVIAGTDIYGGDELARLLRSERVTHAFVTPAALASVDPVGLTDLEVVVVGGEACPTDLVGRWAPGRRMYNAYGPTECTVMSTLAGPMQPGSPVSIGRPVTGARAVVLDSRLRPVPTGALGELYISGVGLAQGYHDRSALTATRFVADPWSPSGTRLYRTGDVVRRCESGDLRYLGRSDSQVKVRGYRIELGEVDAALRGSPGVAVGVTDVRGVAGRPALVAWIVSDTPDATAGVLTHLRSVLPSHAVPTAVVQVDTVPLTASGKVDRRNLPTPRAPERDYAEPRNDLERIVAEQFRRVLDPDSAARFGVHDDFFSVGGNSLLATRLASGIGNECGVTVAVRQIFEAPTVGGLAAVVAALDPQRSRPVLALGRAGDDADVPLSPAQHRMWVLNRFDTSSATYNVPMALRLRGDLDVAALLAAIRDVLERHEPLRTSYPDSPDGPVQHVHPVTEVWDRLDLRPVRVEEAALADHLASSARRGFDVTADVPLRIELLEISERDHVLVCVAHHIGADGSSLAPLSRDVATAYHARLSGAAPDVTALPVRYRDYTVWHHDLMGEETDPGSVVAQQLQYWSSRLAELPERIDLPLDRPHPPVASLRGGCVDDVLDASAGHALAAFAASLGCTPFMATHAALALLLARLSGNSDVAVGTPVAGRGEAALADLVGMFVGTVVLRTDIPSTATVAEAVALVRDADLGAFENADVPFERLVELVNPVRSAGHHPLVQVGLSYQNMAPTEFGLGGLDVEVLEPDVGVAKFDLHLTIVPGPSASTRLQWEFARDVFDHSTVRAISDMFRSLLSDMVADPTRIVGDIALASNPCAPQPVVAARTLTELLTGAFSAHPDETAAVAGATRISYRQLSSTVTHRAGALAAVGVVPESRVAVALPRSAQLVETICAVLVAGGAYVPLDPDAPADRTRAVLLSCRPVLLVTDDEAVAAVAAECGVRTLSPDALDSGPIAESWAAPRPGNTAYVIYTSGSTGTPKGVAVSHGAIAWQLTWKTAHFSLSPGQSTVLKTPITFDLSVWELFWPLLSGATLVIAAAGAHRDPVAIADLIGQHGVTSAHFVPSLLDAYLDAVADSGGSSLERILCIGEELTVATASRAADLVGATVHNLYGPTEVAVGATVHEYDAESAGSSVSIGTAMDGTSAYVLDCRLHPVPPGVRGELYLAGAQVASWYEGRSDLTAVRFVPDPFGGGRMYRTGDLVRADTTGALQFLGRNDFQVKLRGQRIELGDVEAALLHHDRVAGAVATVHAGTRLVGYVVPTGFATSEPGTIEAAVLAGLRERVPPYMIPQEIVLLDALPLTTNGKVDRTALPDPGDRVTPYAPPHTATQVEVAEVIRVVLATSDALGIDDNFFDLGGHSLTATRVAARLGAARNSDIPVRAVFDTPTVRGLAQWLDRTEHQPRPPLVPVVHTESLPLSSSQSRMWVINQLDPASPLYNLPLAVTISGDLDETALVGALGDVLERHSVLRTVYPAVDGVPTQQVCAVNAERVRLRSDAPLDEIAAIGFDVTTEEPVRWILRDTGSGSGTGTGTGSEAGGNGRHVLMFVVHHIAADGGSLGPLLTDVLTAYDARRSGGAPSWAPLPVQYSDFAIWQRALVGTSVESRHPSIEQQFRYWRRTLANLPEALALPADRPRKPTPTGAGATIRTVLPAGVLADLRSLARRHDTTLFMLVHTAFAVALARLTDTDDIVIGTPTSGRDRPELDALVGMFASTVALRTGIDRRRTLAEQLAAVRACDLAALSATEVPFDELVAEVVADRSAAHHPVFQVMLAFQDAAPTSWSHGGMDVELVPIEVPVARFDLHLTVDVPAEHDSPAVLQWTYSTELFDADTAREFSAVFDRVVHHLVVESDVTIAALDVLGERRGAVERWSDGGDSRAGASNVLPDLLIDALPEHSSSAALTFDGVTVSTGEFAERVMRSARGLIAEGVGPDSVVAVVLGRSLEMVIAVHAVVTAGGAYLPIDPDQPVARTDAMLTIADPLVILAGDDLQLSPARASLRRDPRALGEGQSADVVTDADRIAALHPANAAYVLFTSGSTGEPKGVTVPHSGIVNRLAWMQSNYPIGPSDAVLHKTPATFDVSVWELFWGTATGAHTVIAGPSEHRDPARLAYLVDEHRITVAHFVPAVLDVFLDVLGAGSGSSLRMLFTSGEALSAETVRAAQAALTADVHNLYGPTEAAVDVTASTMARPFLARVVPIGRPVPGTSAHVLDSHVEPVGAGVVGELYLGGVQVARGYASRAALTAARFVADPSRPGERLYRTGDLVRWRRGSSNPELEFLGRSDFQMKVRGQRIEPGEVEGALRTHPGVDQAVVVLRDGRLVAYVAGSASEADSIAHVRDLVPAHLVPARVVTLETLPLGPAGKVDRKALPAPDAAREDLAEPTTATEHTVLQLFREVVEHDHVGVHSDFFGVGGNSLVAARVVAGIAERTGVQLPLRDVFDARTPAALAEAVDAAEADTTEPFDAESIVPEQVPLTTAQRQMWVHNRVEPTSAAYHIVAPVRVGAKIDEATLRAAVRDVVDRHESLHTVYPDEADGPGRHLLTPDEVDCRIDAVVRRSGADDSLETVLDGFDLTTDLPLRVVTGPDALYVVLHHIAADGWSMQIVAGDLGDAYLARIAEREPRWDSAAANFTTHVARTRHRLGTEDDPRSVRNLRLDYWQRVLRGAPASSGPPSDHVRPPMPNYRAATVRAHIDDETRSALVDLASEAGASPFMALHAALVVALARSGSGTDIVVGVPTSGRDAPDVADAVGMFVTMVALRQTYTATESFADALHRSRATVLGALGNADVDIEDIVDAAGLRRDASHHPVFQITLNLDDSPTRLSSPIAASVSGLNLDVPVARFDLEFTVTASRREWDVTLVYRPEIYDQSTASRIVKDFVSVVRHAATAPQDPLRSIDLLTADERAKAHGPAWPGNPLLLKDVLAGPAQIDSAAEALIDIRRGSVLTWGDYDAAVHRLARVLIESGAGPEQVVALCLSRSIDSVIALRAVAETGAAFVPVDPGYPAERTAHMLADSGAQIAVTTSADAHVVTSWSGTTLVLDDPAVASDIERRPAGAILDEERRGAVSPDSLAYLIYTSGSTGVPKAVAVTHRGVAAFGAEQDRYGSGATRVLHFASPSFDASLLEIVLAARSGAALVVAPTDVYGGDELADLLREHRITHAFLTPAALDTIEADTALPSLGTVVVGGDACPPALAARWIDRGVAFFNAYGPTESTIMAALSGPMAPADLASGSVPIGSAVVDTRIALTDPWLSDTPLGVIGEISIAGTGLARGYHGKPGLTAATFVADPDGSPGTRRYRTGDLARWTDAGFVHRGRSDFQVKVRGHRIETGEIDSALRAHPSVTAAVTVTRPGPSGDIVLVAYVQVAESEAPTSDIVASLRNVLPDYMIPSTISVVDSMPVTGAGKIDRGALPEPVFGKHRIVACETPEEAAVAAVFRDVLGAGEVGALDNFFASGGNSLSATTVVSRLRKSTGRHLSVRDLFDAPTPRDLAARLVAAGLSTVPELGTIDLPDRIPLSPAQQRMWFLNRFEPTSTTENVPIVLSLKGPLDETAFEGALADLVERHAVLRTVYPDSPDGPRQVVLPSRDVVVKVGVHLVAPPAVPALIEALVRTEFDVQIEPPTRVELYRIDSPVGATAEYIFAMVVHHIGADGLSIAILAADLAHAYERRLDRDVPAWSPLPVQYADYAVWQRALLESDSEREKEYWTSTLAGAPASIELPTDRPRPARATRVGRRHEFTIDADLHASVIGRAAERDASVFMLAHTAFAVLVGRLANTTDVVIGTPIAGRDHEDVASVVGMFVNMLALRTSIPLHCSGSDALAAVRAVDLDAFEHASLPFDVVVGAVAPPRTHAHHPIFQVALSLQNMGRIDTELPGISIDVVDAETGVAEFDLHLTLVDTYFDDGTPGPIDAQLAYATDLFDSTSAATIADRFVAVLTDLVARLDAPVGDLDLGPVADAGFRALEPVHTQPATLASAFEAAARTTPDAVAVVDGDSTLTYGELLRNSESAARTLRNAGVGPETPVAIALPRGIDQVTAMYAVAAAGAAYVPVDPTETDRRARILDIARPAAIITGDGPDTVDARPRTDSSRAAPDNLAYVLFTSGSTGIPKGVAVSNDAVVEQLAWMQKRYPLTADDAVLVKTSAGFDLSVWEYWWALQTGARIVIAPDGVERDPDAMADIITRQGVTVLCAVPATLALLTERGSMPSSVRLILSIGEALPPALAARVQQRSGAELHNLYGPTEAAVSVTGYPVPEGISDGVPSVPIGAAQPSVGVHVLDERLHQVPAGVAGELYLSGIQLARGYFRDPARTSVSFIANPFGPGRLYRTGDVVRSRDGVLEYVGRSDRQVSLRGYRIEPGDVEAALRRLSSVDDAAVAVVDAGTGSARLIAYVAAPVADSSKILDELRSNLPNYLVPSHVEVMDALPRTTAGKVDLARLPRPDVVAREYVAPSSAVESFVADTVADVIGVERIGMTDNFFDVGGNSLAATRVTARVEQEIGASVPVRFLFDAPTVGEFAAVVAEIEVGGADAGPTLRRRPDLDGSPVRIAPAQERIWHAVTSGQSADWNVPLALRIEGVVDPARISAAMREVVERHDALRTIHRDGTLILLAAADAVPDVPVVEVSEHDLERQLHDFAWAPLDLTSGGPIRVQIFRTGPRTHVVALVVHHLSADGQSMAPLLRDMVIAFSGNSGPIDDTGVRYRDYAAWRREVLGDPAERTSEFSRQRTHWVQALSRPTHRPRLRTDRPRPRVWDSSGAAVSFEIDAELHAALVTRAAASGGGLFVVLHAAFAVVLADLADHPDVTVATANANRPHALLTDVIGNFSEDLPLRLLVDDGAQIDDVIDQVRTRLSEGLSHPDISAPVLWDALGLQPSDAENMLFPATLILQAAGPVDSGIDIDGLRVTRESIPNTVAKHELEITLSERTEDDRSAGVSGTLLYPTALFDTATAESIVNGLLVVLRSIAENNPSVGELRAGLS